MKIIDEIRIAGQSLWYDNIERKKLQDGSLAQLINIGLIRGITSNPSIFQKAISTSSIYDITLKPMAWSGLDGEAIFWQLVVEDIQKAAQLFLPLYQQSNGADGYVSLEVNPLIAQDSTRTIEEAIGLWKRVDMPNLMIKIPATKEGIPAIRKCISEGLNINVTLIFSIHRYNEVMEAYLAGLEDRIHRGEPVDRIASVASFFISRIDTGIDNLLQKKLANNEINANQFEQMAGKAAIANARLAYTRFKEVFNSDRFSKLQKYGAKLQRPLWASTSTKNPAYRDVIYVEELIAPDSVNTVPPATLDAFVDHGSVTIRIHENLDGARNLFNRLAEIGILIDQVTGQLETEGVKAFAEAYTSLLQAVDVRRLEAVREIAPIFSPVKEKIRELEGADFRRRLHEKDPSLWSSDPRGQTEIKIRMNWLKTPFETKANPPAYTGFGRELQEAGFTHAVLLGMGGSSLAPEVMSKILVSERIEDAGLNLTILDSTDPLQVKMVIENTPPLNTIYIVASKSGTTGEINAFFDYFWSRTIEAGSTNPGMQFIAVTDPGTKLDITAKDMGFRAVFNADPQVGGRNSALTAFGLVPAAVVGLNIETLNEHAINIAHLCRAEQPIEANPGIVLGTILGTAASQGKDKVTLITEGEWDAFGDWLEQLIAESSGKDGKGIVPVTGEPQLDVNEYSPDRLFVYLEKDQSRKHFIKALMDSGHAVISFPITQDYDLAGQFYIWEVAVATACSIIGVNSFDQPDVQDAKLRTLAGLEAYRKTGSLLQERIAARFTKASILGDTLVGKLEHENLISYIERTIEIQNNKIEYIAINAFLPKNTQNEEILQKLRKKIGKKFQLSTTLGFGPRYLHSTGQLHKGGANNGFFLLITARRQKDLEIPDQGLSFGVMQRAQAIGDLQALQAKNRRVLWVDLDEPDPAILLEK